MKIVNTFILILTSIFFYSESVMFASEKRSIRQESKNISYESFSKDKNSSFKNSDPGGFLDENGNPLMMNNKKTTDSLETDAISQRFLNGITAGDQFGYSVSGAGDVNGDGYQDIIVGAPLNDVFATSAGRAYIYFGGAIFNSNPDVIITGSATTNYLGYSVSAAGDVNGDSYDDVIIGAYGYSGFTGRAYILYGGANMNTVADVTMTGEAAGDNFGYSVSNAGDVNGDGFSDVIVGSQLNDAGGSNSGEAYIFYGGASMNNTPDVTMAGGAADNYFGTSVSSAGDYNGDGFSDVIIGAQGYLSNTGRAYLFLGGSIMNNGVDITFTGSAGYSLGYSVSEAGDFNGDGYSDVVIGASGYLTSRGRAYIYFGNPSASGGSPLTFTGETTNNNFGISVSSAGDANGDGYSDVIIGAPGFNSNTGKAYLYYGGFENDDDPDKFLNGEAAGDNFGLSVSDCGDVNSDGNSDFIAGSNLGGAGGSGTGRAYIFFNAMTGNDISDINFYGTSASETLGESVSNAGDVNGDGFDDMIIGAKGYNSLQGKAYIYFGGNIMNNTPDVTLIGVSIADQFGSSVSAAGDVNGDGFDDVIVGASSYNNGAGQGRAYIYYGGSSMNTAIDVTLTGASGFDFFGVSVSGAGDVNGDGFGDVIIGASGYNSASYQGRAYIYFGGSVMNNTSDVTMTGESITDFFGYSVSNADDVNGDGFDDVIVGAFGFDSGTEQGKAYIFFGGSTMNASPDVSLYGASADDEFGYSVSNAGDVNGDGYYDVIVGASFAPSTTQQGRAYIYYGGIVMNNAADVTLTGADSFDQFGIQVSTAGDVNNDGYDDVFVSAVNADNGSSYVFFGGGSMNSSADILMSATIAEGFGGSISNAGDVNGDGKSDLVVGSSSNDELGLNFGKAYLYMSTAANVNPRISSAEDVPFDQGGFIKMKWFRSGFDVLNVNLITQYKIEVSDPPGAGGFFWENIATIPASLYPTYQHTVATPNDSSSGNSGVLYYRVTAMTSDAEQYWHSNIISAYSLDNLSPAAPSSLSALPDLNSVYLSWNANTEADLHHYIIYRDGIELTTSTGNNFDDANVMDDSVYNYQVAAVDIHGNVSQLSNIANVNFNIAGQINITAALEGFYIPASNNMITGDTLMVYLRNSAFPYSIADSSKGVINGNTLYGNFKFYNAPTGNYYIALKHRNSVETWSAAPQSYTNLSNSNYDFSNLITKAYGSNQIQVDAVPVRFAIYSGDVNQDGTVDATDVSTIDNDASNFVSGYVVTDLTGDDFVDGTDFSIADNNAANFVSAITP